MTTAPVARTDVLGKAALKAGLSPKALASVRTWLAGQLTAQQYAKLAQGGHTTTHIPLRDVFVDLPVSHTPNGDPTADRHRTFFLDRLMRSYPIRLRKAFASRQNAMARAADVGVSEEVRHADNVPTPEDAGWSAVLLIGGPGQGKSTIGQLACQIHRALLLRPLLDQLPLSEGELVRSVLEMLEKAEDGSGTKISLPRRPLLPLQIALPDFAMWLAKAEIISSPALPSLIKFVTNLPSARDVALDSASLHSLLPHLPTLLVLDGFDEVGSQQDRVRIVHAVREFVTYMAERFAACQVVATTRPQGYANELSQIGVQLTKRYLAYLRIPEALSYARKLIEAKIPNPDERQLALTRITEAASDSATQRLFSTPLQVTILSALVQQVGRAPRERWNLFSLYFQYTYNREIERNTYASALLAQHRTHIELIHARVALLLQVEAERDGGASARMTRARLEEVIRAVLAEDEVSEANLEYLVTNIALVAENRLVFLVEPEPGRFGFEIRSLQEFMAAWAITTGRDAEVEARLHEIAKSPMLRNVTLFVASRLYSEGSHLRDVLADRICVALDADAEDEFLKVTAAGALLALETLEEGAVLSQPKRARALMLRAVNLLKVPGGGGEHIRLSRVANEDTLMVLRSALEQVLYQARNSENSIPAAGAWLCLLDSVSAQQSWAMELADDVWTPDVASIIGDVLLSGEILLSRWLLKKIEINPGPFSPHILLSVYPSEEIQADECWSAWLVTVYGLNGGRLRTQTGLPLVAVEDDELRSISAPNGPEPDAPAWRAWISAAKYEVDPNPTTLATALVSIAQNLPQSKWHHLHWRASWPLGCCLLYANDAEHLQLLSTAARAGTLGDYEDWIQAQSQWKGALDILSVVSSLHHDLPWTRNSLRDSQPIVTLNPVSATIAYGTAKNLANPKLLRVANSAFEIQESHFVKAQLAELCIDGWMRAKPLKYDPVKWLLATRGATWMLVPRGRMSHDAWINLLDKCDDTHEYPWRLGFEQIVEALVDSKGHVALQRLAALYVGYMDEFSGGDDIKHISLSKIEEMFAVPQVQRWDRRSEIVLRLLVGRFPADENTELASEICALAHVDSDYLTQVLGALRKTRMSHGRVRALLASIYRNLFEVRLADARRVIRLMRELAQRRGTDLANRVTWDRLGLPFPYPSHPVVSPLLGGVPTQPVFLEALRLVNIGPVHDIELRFKEPHAGQGQWIVLLGPNGSGKTTVLRSLALALRSVKHPAIWPKGVFGTPWQRISDAGEVAPVNSSIIVKLGDGVEHQTTIRPASTIGVNQLPEQDQPRLFPIFAYGCRRGSALGGAAREVNLGDDNGPEIATLFDEGADLIQAETWLVALEGDSPKNARSARIFSSVVESLKQLLELKDIVVEDQRIWAIEKTGARVPFSCLSDGYLTCAGWFLDLVARWVTISERSNLPLEHNFLNSMRGLVLIDEIDLHLHPQWQVEIISRTRRVLPQMSFVATTHNPLTIVGVAADEIWILARESNRVSVKGGSESPLLLTGGQIYNRYFGISDIYPDSIGRDLRRYSFLSGYAMRSDDEQREMEQLIDGLRKHKIDPGWVAVERSAPDGIAT